MDMTTHICRSINEPDRTGQSWDERWKGPDQGLITCWEVGRKLRESKPELAEKALAGELPTLGWKGGLAEGVQIKKKYGSLNYLAQWQALRGEGLDIDLSTEPSLTCSKSNAIVTFTSDISKYSKG
jgi:hypothetical protein